ncbi:hypothetical protein R69927_05544 [Paraburkholderia domus]|jgi:hypothetical protein|uniref:Uncharacterized protein n=1 Tax=Paraburkholderia domus TaxID=2793075 RepID=A0A9N8N7Q7_9BURK|nr:hypothetical protein R70006_06404 [Paraburkholderia domus]CAE6869357.1 hypothetical protein R69749_06045 [Paraburkholderia domus]CAE6903761.1 hypothetical protein R69927_05544 [Paraburkholderia domus]CAE6961494.1 hypothetical protein R70211_06987 [Paraburkholderia domus]CAE6967848.1 hypothetical protein R70199_07886 [Paraburkholderia domus]
MYAAVDRHPSILDSDATNNYCSPKASADTELRQQWLYLRRYRTFNTLCRKPRIREVPRSMPEGNASFPGRIRELHRIPTHISIRVRLPTRPADRVLADESCCARVVVAIAVVNKRPDANPPSHGPPPLSRQGFAAYRLHQQRIFSRRDSRLIRISKQVQLQGRYAVTGAWRALPRNASDFQIQPAMIIKDEAERWSSRLK